MPNYVLVMRRGAIALLVMVGLAAAPPVLASTGRASQVASPRETVLGPHTTGRFEILAQAVGDPLGSSEGPGLVLPHPEPATAGEMGEGVVWLTMRAPGTSWASRVDTSVVVDVSVDGGTSQQIVLFDGANPFTYTGFTGPLAVGPHILSVAVSPTLSHTAASPIVDVDAAELGVVLPSDPDYWTDAYAPVIYGRESSASKYTPLLVDASDAVEAGGDHSLQYVLAVSAHDQGDSIVPAYQWALWGRMTDIVSIVDETVAPDGAVTQATYASCGCEQIPDFPDWVMAPEETTASIPLSDYDGHHPVLRNASATNYLSDTGTTPFRFQQAPLAAPPPGQVREEVMDAHPWTYQISNEELPREHLISTNPDDLLVGDYRQYAIIDSNIVEQGAQDVQFEIQVAGNPTWYSTDYRQMTAGVPSTIPFNDGGHTRTVVKLPLGWGRITGLRIRLDASFGSLTPRRHRSSPSRCWR
jgi:hypothetical protein